MANQVIKGFRAVGTLSGAPLPTPMVREVANNYATAIGIGDVLAAVSDGTVAVAATSDNGKLIGVATGFSYMGGVPQHRIYANYLPANTTFSPTTVGSVNASLCEFVPCTPDVIFAVQADDGTTFTTIATQIGAIQENCDLATGTADSVTGWSGELLDISTHGTGTANFRIIGIRGYTLEGLQLQTNDPTVTNFEFLVVCNESVWPTGTATGV